MHLGEMAEENTTSCKEDDGQIITQQEILIRKDKVFQSIEENDTTNEVAVVLKGEQRQVAKMRVT